MCRSNVPPHPRSRLQLTLAATTHRTLPLTVPCYFPLPLTPPAPHTYTPTHPLQALDYLHCARKVVHGDLKPENALMGAAGRVALSDFGCRCGRRLEAQHALYMAIPRAAPRQAAKLCLFPCCLARCFGSARGPAGMPTSQLMLPTNLDPVPASSPASHRALQQGPVRV